MQNTTTTAEKTSSRTSTKNLAAQYKATNVASKRLKVFNKRNTNDTLVKTVKVVNNATQYNIFTAFLTHFLSSSNGAISLAFIPSIIFSFNNKFDVSIVVSRFLVHGLFIVIFSYFFSILLHRSKKFSHFMLALNSEGLTLNLIAKYVALSLVGTLCLQPFASVYTDFLISSSMQRASATFVLKESSKHSIMLSILLINFAGIFFSCLEKRIDRMIENRVSLAVGSKISSIRFSVSFKTIILPVALFTSLLVACFMALSKEKFYNIIGFISASFGTILSLILLIALPAYLQIRSLVVETMFLQNSMLSNRSISVLACITAFISDASLASIVLLFDLFDKPKIVESITKNLCLYILALRMLTGYFTKLADINADRIEDKYGENSLSAVQMSFYDSMGDVVGDTLGYNLTLSQIVLYQTLANHFNNVPNAQIISDSTQICFSNWLPNSALLAFTLSTILRIVKLLLVAEVTCLIFNLSSIKKLTKSFFVRRITFGFTENLIFSFVSKAQTSFALSTAGNTINFISMFFVVLQNTFVSSLRIFLLIVPFLLGKLSNEQKSPWLNNVAASLVCTLFGAALQIFILCFGYNSDISGSAQHITINNASLVYMPSLDTSSAVLFTLLDSATTDVVHNKTELENLDVLGNAIAGVTKSGIACFVIKEITFTYLGNLYPTAFGAKNILLEFMFFAILIASALYLAFASIKYNAVSGRVEFEAHYIKGAIALIALPLSVLGYIAIKGISADYFVTSTNNIAAYMHVFMSCLEMSLFTLGAAFDNWKKRARQENKQNSSSFNRRQLSFALKQDFLGDVIKDFVGPAMTCFRLYSATFCLA